MDPLTLMAIASLATTAFSIDKQNKQIKAANSAQVDAGNRMVAGQNQKVLEGFKKRREMQGTMLGGSPEAAAASQEGTILTGASSQRSLLG